MAADQTFSATRSDWNNAEVVKPWTSITTTNVVAVPQAGSPVDWPAEGGGGSTRPSTGMLYPRYS